MNQIKPRVQALLVADQIYQDRITGKVVVCGIFSNVGILRQTPNNVELNTSDSGIQLKPHDRPGVKGSPYAYVCLVDVRAKVELELRFTNLKADEVLFTAIAEVEGDNPLDPLEMIIPLPRLPISAPGVHVLELLTENELLGAWRIQANYVDEEPAQ